MGRAQEKALVCALSVATTRPGTLSWLVRSTVFINYFYFYCLDEHFARFIKFSSSFPYTAKLCINGTNAPSAKRRRPASGLKRSITGSPRSTMCGLQAICDSLGPAQIDALLRKWLRILPTPFTDEDQAAGYRYELSILQAEFSLTQMLARRCPGGLLRAGHPRQP